MHALVQFITEHVDPVIAVLITSALPLIELRGAIPVGMSLGMSAVDATILSYLGSIVPVPFILLLIKHIFKYLETTKVFGPIVSRLTHKTMNTNADKIEKYGAWGLLIFVAIPLPGTGVWSGSLAASLMNMRFKWAFPSILIGNAIAGLIIMALSSGVFSVIGN